MNNISTIQYSMENNTKGKGIAAFRFGAAARVPLPTTSTQRVGDYKVFGWGKDNLYPNQLVNLYLESPLHGGIINGKVHFITAGGMKYEGENIALWTQIYNNYESEYNLDDIASELCRDGEIFNAFAVLCRKRLGTNSYTIEHINFEELRLVEKEDKDEPTRWAHCVDWSDSKLARNATIYDEFIKGEEQPVFIYVWTAHSKTPKERLTYGGKLVATPYPNPPYNSGIRAIMTDVSIQQFDYNEIANNFAGGTHLHFSDGIPDDDDKKAFERDIEDKTQGPENAGFTLVTYSDGDSRKPVTITSLMGNNQPDRYINKSKRVEDSILQAHSVTSGLLFGIKTAGQLGGSEELDIAYAIMKANYFSSKKRLLADFFKALFRDIYNLVGEIDFNEFSIEFSPAAVAQPTPQPTEAPTEQFVNEGNDGDIVSMFASVGRPKEHYKVIEGMPVYNPDDNERTEAERMSAYQFADLPEMAVRVLALIKEKNDYGAILQALELDQAELSEIYELIIEEGLFDPEANEITEAGERVTTPNIEVLYSYELREGVSGPDILPDGRTRPFCEQLINLNRLYTREEINTISERADRNVWLFKGGWYHDPNTNTNLPFCRHTWVQNVVQAI